MSSPHPQGRASSVRTLLALHATLQAADNGPALFVAAVQWGMEEAPSFFGWLAALLLSSSVRPSVGPSLRRSVRWLVGWLVSLLAC